MNKLDVTKAVVNFVVGAGVTKIVNDIVANNTNPENIYQKVTVVSGAVVVGMMAKDASKVYTSAKIDEYAQSLRELKASIKKADQEKK